MCRNLVIKNNKLHPDMVTLTLRDGRQAFRTKSGHAAPLDSSNAELLLKRPRPELYAKLIDGVWCWVNGCEECNGYDRAAWRGYECAEHDRCTRCGLTFNELDVDERSDTVNGSYGWVCGPCYTHIIDRHGNTMNW